ncbi:MAG: cysteine--tRNA ligase [Firmicutes bacterium]|jgi:L-cysteine:1D-myo-inositol 2-amino-2-deoxy-alpha-D-glucopyranoside ligase|nr:cysteine--tRNA ligase [Bacillota bacterium]
MNKNEAAPPVAMRIYDTATQENKDFAPKKVVKLYTCGITPYDSAHLGHAATYLTYDVLQRHLRDKGYETRCVRNITDVDDDLLAKARQLEVNYLDLAAREIAKFQRDMKALGLLPCYGEPRATSAIHDILGFIAMVLEAGYAYTRGGSVYFDVSSFAQFGQISHLSREEMLDLAKERGGHPEDPYKEDPLDFVLWQPSLEDEPSWDSLWGPGRPGWHIECSALALRELGESIDIHGGGTDLIFPHHECETAQSESVTKKQFAKHWMHVAMLRYEGEKMSKSLGNLVFVSDLLKDHSAAAIRLALLSRHYRDSIDWSSAMMDTAEERLDLWKKSSLGKVTDSDGSTSFAKQVRQYLDDDLDVPSALLVIDEAAHSGYNVVQTAALLGVDLSS